MTKSLEIDIQTFWDCLTYLCFFFPLEIFLFKSFIKFLHFFSIVAVKWGKKKFDDLEVDTDESPELFKAQLCSLTSVAPDRQKIMLKGSVLKVMNVGLRQRET